MTANVRGFTPNHKFKLINFDTPRWHTLEYDNWQQLDALLLATGVAPVRGEWTNSTSYTAGARVFDPDTGSLYRALVNHTSASSGTFEDDRTANPGRWVLQDTDTPIFRGAWTALTTYMSGDIVTVTQYSYYLCVKSHTSSATFTPDAPIYWQLVFDGTDVVNSASDDPTVAQAAANTATAGANSATVSASQAQTYANNAAVSAGQASTSASQASTSATNAQTSATAAATSATNAQNSANAAATSATNAANSATQAAQSALNMVGTSTTSNDLTTGNKTFTTQSGKYFNVGSYVLVVDNANPTVNYLHGKVTSYSGTTLGMTASAVGGTGTKSDWTIYVSGAQGSRGLNWLGAWSAATAYVLNDAVFNTVNGSSYVCINPHTNQQPPNATYWSTLAVGGAAAIADDSITPAKLDADTAPLQLLMRDRLNFVTRDAAGDTMSGDLAISKATPAFVLNKPASGTAATIFGKTNNINRWHLSLGTAAAETGADAGSAFTLTPYTDAGVALSPPAITGSRVDGLLTVRADPTAALGIATKQSSEAAATAAASNRVAKGGDTMSGPLIIPVKDNQIGVQGGTN